MNSESLFWGIAEDLMANPAVEEGTMMGHRCVRVDGRFAAMHSSSEQALIVKLTKDRVLALIADGTGAPFAPAGKVFSEWVLINRPDLDTWSALMAEAVDV